MGRQGFKGIVVVGLLCAGAVLASGCTVLHTASQGVSSTVQGVSAVTSSTSPGGESAAFIENRYASIRAEAARGEGEHLDTLAKLLGETDRVEFARFMKARYSELFTGLQEPRELLDRIDRYRAGRQAHQGESGTKGPS